jgi:FdrA protein
MSTETNPKANQMTAAKLLTEPIRVINIGLDGFAEELKAQGVPVTHVQWAPPANGDPKLAALLAKLGM